jgi:hypothetical protein
VHVEVFVEEQSAAAALAVLLPRILPAAATWRLHPHRGKKDLLQKLPSRLRAYSHWLPRDWRILVLVDKDRDDCHVLKEQLNRKTQAAGLHPTRSRGTQGIQVLNRLAIEELEAWFFGDVPAICAAYPGVPTTLAAQARYREPDAIAGGTWEALERVLRRAGHHTSGLRKVEAAGAIASHMDPGRNRSPSFQCFRDGLLRLAAATEAVLSRDQRRGGTVP